MFSSKVSLIAGVDTGATKPHLIVAECVTKCCAAFGRDRPHLAHRQHGHPNLSVCGGTCSLVPGYSYTAWHSERQLRQPHYAAGR